VLSLLFLNGSFLNFSDASGSVIKVTFAGIQRVTEGGGFEQIGRLIPLSALLIIIPLFSLITIFIFKNRIIQLWLALTVIIAVILQIVAFVAYSFIIIARFNAELVPGFKLVIPVIMLVLSILAYAGIRKDERLVKSYDRLR
jgi:hypothetical protein